MPEPATYGAIRFQRQLRLYGCMYYSAAAVCDVPAGWAEEHEADCSVERFTIRLYEAGYLLCPFYVDPSRPADTAFWERISGEIGSQGFDWVDLALAIDSPTYRGVSHAVVLRLYFHDEQVSVAVVVDTSGFDAPQTFDWPHFLDSEYAAAKDVRLIWSNALDAWRPVDGPSQPHALDPEACRR